MRRTVFLGSGSSRNPMVGWSRGSTARLADLLAREGGTTGGARLPLTNECIEMIRPEGKESKRRRGAGEVKSRNGTGALTERGCGGRARRRVTRRWVCSTTASAE